MNEIWSQLPVAGCLQMTTLSLSKDALAGPARSVPTSRKECVPPEDHRAEGAGGKGIDLEAINNSKCPHLWFPSSFQALCMPPLIQLSSPTFQISVTVGHRKVRPSSALIPQLVDSEG